MAVGDVSMPVMHPVAGVKIGFAEAGIRYKNRRDLVVFELAAGTHTAAVFASACCSAPFSRGFTALLSHQYRQCQRRYRRCRHDCG